MAFFDQTLPTAAGNVLSDGSTKVAEAATQTVTTLGGNGNFTKVAASAPPLTQTGAQSTFRAAEISQSSGQDLVAALDETSRLSAENAYTYNAMSSEQATQAVLAADSSVSASQINQTAKQNASDDHMVKLQEPDGPTVKFLVMPEISEQRNVEYEAIAPPQSPGAFQKYKGTAPTQWTINATLTSRTTDEATRNLEIINILRGWTMPYFGENTRVVWPTKLGAPPPVLWFSGFRKQMVGKVPVVITGVSWNFPQDVDYIPAMGFKHSAYGLAVETGDLIPFPTVMKITINVVESFSTDQFNGFSLADFRVGQMEDAWRSLPSGTYAASAASQPQAGVTQPKEEAQKVPPTGAGAGRGTRGGPSAQELAAYNLSNPTKPPAIGKTYNTELQKAAAVPPLVSGQGGDFGGGGATGSF